MDDLAVKLNGKTVDQVYGVLMLDLDSKGEPVLDESDLISHYENGILPDEAIEVLNEKLFNAGLMEKAIIVKIFFRIQAGHFYLPMMYLTPNQATGMYSEVSISPNSR